MVKLSRSSKPTFIDIGDIKSLTLTSVYYRIANKGFLDYEYNPLHNYRLSKDRYKTGEGEYADFYLDGTNNIFKFTSTSTGISQYVTKNTIGSYLAQFGDNAANDKNTPPTANRLVIDQAKGSLVDFITSDLNFDLNHPVDIEIQESYDGSVNLILNDDLNNPRIINTRFTPKENNQFEVIDRSGNNDTNIYDEDNLDGETNLYKLINKLPILTFNGVLSGGQLPVGNYVFYFKYYDSDGNETDFVEESSIVSIFKGSTALDARGYLSSNTSDKLVQFTLSNIDSAYDYVSVYYTRSTGSNTKTEITEAYKIDTKYIVRSGSCVINITGLEQTTKISINDINISYNVVDSVKTQAQVQSRLFFGNVHKPDIPYEELKDLSLRIYPEIYQEESIGYVSCDTYLDISDAPSSNKYEYANVNNIYYRLGYWEDIYNFGIVYILNDYTLSPVFPILGVDMSELPNNIFDADGNLTEIYKTFFNVYNGENKRHYLSLAPDGIFMNGENVSVFNCKGVVNIKLPSNTSVIDSNSLTDGIKPIGIKFKFLFAEEVKEILNQYTKGYFFVRQKRIPTILCQGITIGLDEYSHLPMIPVSYSDNTFDFLTESFIDEDRYLTHDFSSRTRYLNNCVFKASIIPEAELNSELYSQLFSSIKYNLTTPNFQPSEPIFTIAENDLNYNINSYDSASSSVAKEVTLTYVADGIQLVSSKDTEFSSQAGTAEDITKFAQLEVENREATNVNITRGQWGSYVGIDGFDRSTTIFNVMTSGYDENRMREYIIVRGNSNEPYFAISPRYSYEDGESSKICYRGDCFIGNFSHRMLRNFQDPEAPNNDIIVKESTWRDNYSGYTDGGMDTEQMAEINRGDINAVTMGHWITFKCMSNINLALRCEDDSNASELALIGHARTFAPASWFNVSGEYKVPESTLFNTGYNSTTSDKYNFILPDIPYIKNDFTNRVMYSDIHITDAFKNAYRTFNISDYRDYSKEFGSLIYITEWFGDLLVVFEHGIGILPINERVQTAGSGNGQVYLNSDKVLPERPIMISKTYGTQWKDSCIKSELYLYGVDTVAKKIWRTNGRQLELISDFKIQTFLNDNIQLTERELTPLIGIRNVKSHFNGFKYDIMFTFYNDIKSTDNLGNPIETCEWNICYNEKLGLWTTRYSWIPLLSENINNIYFSYDKNSAKNISCVAESWSEGDGARGIVLGDCYSNDDYIRATDTNVGQYLSNVIYPGIEVPLHKGDADISTTSEIPIGKLSVLLDGFDESEYKKLMFRLDLADDVKNDNNLIKLVYISKDGTKYYTEQELEDSGVTDYQSYIYFLPTALKYAGMSNFINGVDYIKEKYIIKIELEAEVYNTDVSTSGLTLKDTLYIRLSQLEEVSWDLVEKYTTTQFWKHGVAGLIDNEEDGEDGITNCRWYGKNEPFEFEFIVNAEPGRHKIFDNLVILSNNVMPSQIQYEIIGDAYWFKKIKKDSYNLQQNGIVVDGGTEDEPKYLIGFKNKFYYKDDTGHYLTSDGSVDLIHGDFQEFTEYSDDGTAGPFGENYKLPVRNAELFKDRKLNQYAIRKYQDIKNIEDFGNIIGNAIYKEDLVLIEIDPILVNKYEIIDGVIQNIETSEDLKVFDDGEYTYQEIRPKDKYMKLRICYNTTPYIKTEDRERYKENDNTTALDKPIITSLQVIYTPSYS